MKENNINKNKAGFALIHLILVIAIVVGVILLAIPIYRYYKTESDRRACSIELATARDMITIDYLTADSSATPSSVRQTVTYTMDGWESLCPAGGDTYIIDNPDADEPPYTVVCSLHDDDEYLKVRLNAGNALRQIRKALASARLGNKEIPDEVSVTLNGMTCTAVRRDETPSIRRGTTMSTGYEDKDLVILWSAAEEVTDDNGGISCFVYADKDHCARWDDGEDWSGDAFAQ